MTKITLANRKGGVGKTTMAGHLATGLATLGHRVGLVDTDSQGHVSAMLGLAERNGLFELMIEKAALEDVAVEVGAERYSTHDQPAQGALYAIQSSALTYKIPYEIGAHEGFLFLDLMDEFEEAFGLDYVVIDTNPTMSMLDGAIYLATDGFIYVTECERLSFDGVKSAVGQMLTFQQQRQKHLGRDSRVLGIIPNKLRANTVLHRENIAKLAQAFPGMVWPPVVLHIAWAEAQNFNETVYTYAPTGNEANDAWTMVKRTMEAMERWRTA